MTIQELEQYRDLQAEASALQAELWQLNDTYHSPAFSSIGARSTSPGNPTEQAAMKKLAIEKRLLEKQQEIAGKMLQIEQWLDSVTDSQIRSIVRWHYMLGLSWKQTSAKVCGSESYYNARKAFRRYMGIEK